MKESALSRSRARGRFQASTRNVGPSHHEVQGSASTDLHYCYELHIIVKHPASVKRVSFLLREDVRKMERYIAQTRLLSREGIDTGQQLEAYQNSLEDRMEQLTQQRRDLRNRLKAATGAGNGEAIDRLESQIADLSAQIVVARKEIGLCSENRERSEQVARKLIDINKQLEEVEKTHEYSRRFGRPNREDVPQWSSVWPRDRKPLGPPASLQKPSALFRCAA